jgi:hypothetical protein
VYFVFLYSTEMNPDLVDREAEQTETRPHPQRQSDLTPAAARAHSRRVAGRPLRPHTTPIAHEHEDAHGDEAAAKTIMLISPRPETSPSKRCSSRTNIYNETEGSGSVVLPRCKW